MSYDFDPQLASWDSEGGAQPRPSKETLDAAEQLMSHGMTKRAVDEWAAAESSWEAEGGALPPERLL